MQLCGTGTGPQAKFTKAELDFGDVAVYTNKTLDVEIVNTVRLPLRGISLLLSKSWQRGDKS